MWRGRGRLRHNGIVTASGVFTEVLGTLGLNHRKVTLPRSFKKLSFLGHGLLLRFGKTGQVYSEDCEECVGISLGAPEII